MTTRLLTLLLAFTLTGYAQTTAVTARRNILKISPLVAIGHVSVFYERVVGPRTSLLIGAGFGGQSYPYKNNSTQVPEPGRYHYERLTLEARHYFGRRSLAPFGFFTGGYGRFARLSSRDYTFDKGNFVRDQAGNLVLLDKRMTVATVGGYVGWQTLVFRRITFEVFQGIQVKIPSGGVLSSASLPEAMSSAGLEGRIGLTLGYQF